MATSTWHHPHFKYNLWAFWNCLQIKRKSLICSEDELQGKRPTVESSTFQMARLFPTTCSPPELSNIVEKEKGEEMRAFPSCRGPGIISAMSVKEGWGESSSRNEWLRVRVYRAYSHQMLCRELLLPRWECMLFLLLPCEGNTHLFFLCKATDFFYRLCLTYQFMITY